MGIKPYNPSKIRERAYRIRNWLAAIGGSALVAIAVPTFLKGESTLDKIINEREQGMSIAETINPRQNRQREKLLQTSNVETNVGDERNYSTRDFAEDNDEYLLARMIYGEARGESKEEQIAVAYAVLNRVKAKSWYGDNLREVILKPHQFSCFSECDVNRKELMNPNKEKFEECLEVARGVLLGEYKDITNGATHYFNPRKANPKWFKKMERANTPSYFKHEFYRE